MVRQHVFLLSLLVGLVLGSPSWRSRGVGHRYSPPLPHMYQMLGPPNDDSAVDQEEYESRESVEEVDPRFRWREDGDVDDYPAREFNKKMVQPVHFNEARLHPVSGSSGVDSPSNRQMDKASATTSPVPRQQSEDEEDDRRKKEFGMEGLWMKKKKRSRSITLKKREGRMSANEQQKLLGELGNILKDDDTNDAHKKKQQTSLAGNVKRQVNASEGEAKEPSEHQKFEDWLKQEYLRNMALSFATAKKKKRSPSLQQRDELRKKRKAGGNENDEELDRSSGLGREFFDPETLDAVKERLKLIENAVLADAIQKIILRARDDSAAEVSTGSQKIANRLAEAYYIEKLKQTIDKLPHNWGKFREEENPDEMDGNPWKKRGSMNLAEALPVMAPTDNKRQEMDQEEAVDEEAFEVCPELQLLTSDCSALDGFLPNSPMTSTLRHFCNKHEVCYTCGEAFGLTSSDCDGLFLRDTMALCRASGLCHGEGDLLLQPLHERRVFYKRSVPAICYRAPCVQAFLLEQ